MRALAADLGVSSYMLATELRRSRSEEKPRFSTVTEPRATAQVTAGGSTSRQVSSLAPRRLFHKHGHHSAAGHRACQKK